MKLNPESMVLQQLDGEWQKIAAMLVWKLARDGVRITLEDMKKYADETDTGKAVLFTHGHKDNIEFRIVDSVRAEALAAYYAKHRGRA